MCADERVRFSERRRGIWSHHDRFYRWCRFTSRHQWCHYWSPRRQSEKKFFFFFFLALNVRKKWRERKNKYKLRHQRVMSGTMRDKLWKRCHFAHTHGQSVHFLLQRSLPSVISIFALRETPEAQVSPAFWEQVLLVGSERLQMFCKSAHVVAMSVSCKFRENKTTAVF